MVWMALLGLALVAGVVILVDDDDDDVVTGGSGGGGGEETDPHTGGVGDDIILGGEEDDTLLGRNGDDDLNGRRGDDRVFGDGGMDTVSGGMGDDSIYGGNGNDLVLGGDQHDLTRGGRDEDVLIDTVGTDTMYGDGGSDLLIGSGTMSEDAEEALLANPDPENGIANLLDQLQIDLTEDTDRQGDHLDGGSGNDTLLFGVNDTVTGGADADTFITASWLEGHGPAVVTDFDPAEDQLVYAYNRADGDPELTVETSENDDGTSDAVIFANGSEVIRVEGQGETFDIDEHLTLIYGAR